MSALVIHSAASENDYSIARQLFQEYAASLDFDLCFQNFESELAHLPEEYGPPQGCLLLASYKDQICGCVGLRKLEEDICEMKRLYVKPESRKLGIGKMLSEAVIEAARHLGYQKMRLDTLQSMVAAREIYRKMGFIEIASYRFNPILGAVYMELALQQVINHE